MFDDLVERYDLVNSLLSMGLDRSWRRSAANAARTSGSGRILDLGCGTGELGLLLADRNHVVGLDVSHRMLLAAKRKGWDRLILARGSAFALPFAGGAFGGAVSGFVLRNLDDLPLAFSELSRVLEPGAPVALVDITEPRNPLVRRLFDAYLAVAAPALGWLVGRRAEYRYLVRSLAQLPEPAEICTLLERAGFERCAARPLTGGMVTLFTAHVPTSAAGSG
jgi:demethylmenaquinone methyltransferase/2-methoxy-6-polyprenyl-1,4-benzoquinol methylase